MCKAGFIPAMPYLLFCKRVIILAIDYSKTQDESLDNSYEKWQRMCQIDTLYRDAQSENQQTAQQARADLAFSSKDLIDYKQHRSEYLDAYRSDDKKNPYTSFDDVIMKDGYASNMQSDNADIRARQAESMKFYEQTTGHKLVEPAKAVVKRDFGKANSLGDFSSGKDVAEDTYQK